MLPVAVGVGERVAVAGVPVVVGVNVAGVPVVVGVTVGRVPVEVGVPDWATGNWLRISGRKPFPRSTI
jgi:hypothetical protein